MEILVLFVKYRKTINTDAKMSQQRRLMNVNAENTLKDLEHGL